MSADPDNGRRSGREEVVDAAPGLARVAASAWMHTVEWAIGTSLRAGSKALRTAGITPPAGEASTPPVDESSDAEDTSARTLRARGEELLRRSADVDFRDDTHPAYARILSELAPDEGRILRLLAVEGPQPAVDVRAGWLPFHVGSELVAAGLTMIGAEAGARNPDRVPAYLNNLNRLGLVWFSREAVTDTLRYQVLEAQPEVTEALERAGHGRTVRRSIHLTPFGRDFCELVLPVDTAEIEALPAEHDPLEPTDAAS